MLFFIDLIFFWGFKYTYYFLKTNIFILFCIKKWKGVIYKEYDLQFFL